MGSSDPASEFEESRELLEQARQGDGSAFSALFDRHQERLLGRIRLMMGPQARRVAESGDFLHGVFVEILQRSSSGPPADEEEFLRWATAIARNNIRDELRRARERALDSLSLSLSDVLAGGSDDSPETRVSREELILRLVREIERLDPDHRQVIELRDLEGLAYAEVGRRMRRSPDAARMLHHRAQVRLARLLERTGPGA